VGSALDIEDGFVEFFIHVAAVDLVEKQLENLLSRGDKTVEGFKQIMSIG
jgi:hypothetical protein